ncbi:hypothetical protein SAMN02745116_01397 [Pilibacter termitis]|uniref:Uncharacterized protein n=1 Tax=Pilibacter termitis TaxID=263852 RepID=A0A1T4NDV4_9ENTE|nr:hypothetical protein [Pilibacter termitis]SJZ77459.1 hypothetical protein SAMN02745116_01397 [Pilibacter termitis]
MAQALRVENLHNDEIVILSKKEYEQMEKELARNKAKIRFFQEMQQPLIEMVEGKTKSANEVLQRLRAKRYD